MSSEGLESVIRRAMSDEGFCTQLVSDPDGTAAAHGLSPEELDALKSGDNSRLRLMGVGEELSRFTLIEMGPKFGWDIGNKVPAVQQQTEQVPAVQDVTTVSYTVTNKDAHGGGGGAGKVS